MLRIFSSKWVTFFLCQEHHLHHEGLQRRSHTLGLSGPSGLATLMAEAGTPTDRRTVWRWSTGRRTPDRATWPALADALQVPLDHLALRVVGVTPMAPLAGEE